MRQITKQLYGKKLTISDDSLKETLEKIDNSGSPLYAYLLAQQLNESQTAPQGWTKIILLNNQLQRNKKRWQQAFKGVVPYWGDHHPAMKIAVLATIVRKVRFQDIQIEQCFDNVNLSVRKEAVAITSGYLINDDNCPDEIHGLEPDLLGEWFVLYCFYKGHKFDELLDIAWEYSPNETASFLQRIAQDFSDLHKKYNNWNLTEKLLAHKPPHENHYQALANVASDIAHRLHQSDLTIPQNIIVALEYAANLSDTVAMSSLGLLYQQGISVTRNLEKAFDWYQRAVELGDSSAMVKLGACYENGEGVEQDWDKAIDLYQHAVKAGEKSAINNIQNILLLQNFLGEGKYKIPHLKAPPVFDSPIMAGDWKQFTAKEVAANLDKVIASFEILELVEKLDGYLGQYARYLPLNFYKECSLVDIQLYNPSNKNTLIFSAIFNTGNAILLNAKSNVIHTLNPYLLTFNNKNCTIDYLRFFLLV